MANEPWAELGEVISAIRAQLQEAIEAAPSGWVRFRSGPVELEFSIVVRKDGTAAARILVLPWSADARATTSSEQVHRINLTLQPIDDTGGDARISSRSLNRPA